MHEVDILRDDRRRCSSGDAFKLQGTVDYHRAVGHILGSINDRRNYKLEKQLIFNTLDSGKLEQIVIQFLNI